MKVGGGETATSIEKTEGNRGHDARDSSTKRQAKVRTKERPFDSSRTAGRRGHGVPNEKKKEEKNHTKDFGNNRIMARYTYGWRTHLPTHIHIVLVDLAGVTDYEAVCLCSFFFAEAGLYM